MSEVVVEGEAVLELPFPRKKLFTSTLGLPTVEGVVVAELVLLAALEDEAEVDDIDKLDAELMGTFPFAGVPAAIEPKDCTARPSALMAGTSAGDEDNGADWSFTEPNVIAPPKQVASYSETW